MKHSIIRAPLDSEIVLLATRTRSWLAISPPGAPSAFRAVYQPDTLVSVLNISGRATGPDQKARQLATSDLMRGRPVLIEYARFADALAARAAVMRAMWS